MNDLPKPAAVVREEAAGTGLSASARRMGLSPYSGWTSIVSRMSNDNVGHCHRGCPYQKPWPVACTVCGARTRWRVSEATSSHHPENRTSQPVGHATACGECHRAIGAIPDHGSSELWAAPAHRHIDRSGGRRDGPRSDVTKRRWPSIVQQRKVAAVLFFEPANGRVMQRAAGWRSICGKRRRRDSRHYSRY